MIARFEPVTVLFALAVSLLSCGRVPEPTIAIVGGSVFDATGAPMMEDVTVFVRDGVIDYVGPASGVSIPMDAEIVDATGKFVVPGFVDAHVHFSMDGAFETDVDRLLRQFLFYGVTSVLNLGATSGDIETIDSLRVAIRQNIAIGPHIYATGGLITIPGSHPTTTIMAPPASGDWTDKGVWIAETPDDVVAAVARGAAAGMDAVKVVVESGPSFFGDSHPQMSAEMVMAAVAAAKEHGLPVVAHATSIDELDVVTLAEVRAVAHLVPDAPTDLLERMVSQGIYYIPTLSMMVWADVWDSPSEHLTDPFLRAGVEERVLQRLRDGGALPTTAPTPDEWQWRSGFVGAVGEAHGLGVAIVAGTDLGNPMVFPGFSMHFELELMVEAGMTPAEALMAATRRPAEMLNKADDFGTIRVGRRADLLVLGRNPLLDIRNTQTLELVILAGRRLQRERLLAPR